MDTDVALAAQLARDLDAAFPTLVAAHADRLYTIALRLLGDGRDAEEVAQDALVRAYRAMAAYPADRTRELRLRPWLAAIAVNLARNRRRNLADRMPPATLDGLVDDGFDRADATAEEPSKTAEDRADAAELAELLLRLPAHLRAAVVLRHVDGLSVAETAAALERPEGTVKAQVSRGLERLRGMLLALETEGSGLSPDHAAGPATAARPGAHHSLAPPAGPVTRVLARRAAAAPEVLR